MTNILYIPFRVIGNSRPGYPIHSTEGMPEELITVCAPAGFIFLALIFYSHYKTKLKKKLRNRERDIAYKRFVDRQNRLARKK